MMTCHEMNAKLADLLLEPDADGLVLPLNGERHADRGSRAWRSAARDHMVQCAPCRGELDELKATMALLDGWEAPEPNPYFMTRLGARLDEERAGAPASWLERLRARLVYGSRLTLRPVAAVTMSVVLLLSGGAYLGLSNWSQPPAPGPVVHDLQALDNNAQLLDQLETLSSQNDD